MYVLKGIKNFKGHEGEPCVQGTLHGAKGKVAEWSDDSWGGPMRIHFAKPADEAAFSQHAKSLLEGTLDYDGKPLDVNALHSSALVERGLGHLVEAALKEKAEKDAIKKGYIVYYAKGKDGGADVMYATNLPYTPAQVAALLAETPDLVSIVNELHKQPFADGDKLKREEENKRYRKLCKTMTLFSLREQDGTVKVMQSNAAYSAVIAARLRMKYPNLVEIINERY